MLEKRHILEQWSSVLSHVHDLCLWEIKRKGLEQSMKVSGKRSELSWALVHDYYLSKRKEGKFKQGNQTATFIQHLL